MDRKRKKPLFINSYVQKGRNSQVKQARKNSTAQYCVFSNKDQMILPTEALKLKGLDVSSHPNSQLGMKQKQFKASLTNVWLDCLFKLLFAV